MRFYSFTNLYTAGIHAGIQTAHAVHEMERKYAMRSSSDDINSLEKLKVYHEWAARHKTIIVLQGGYSASLDALYDELKPISAYLQLPVIRWRESKEALNGATTAVGIIVPEYVYKERFAPDDGAEPALFGILSRYRMAV